MARLCILVALASSSLLGGKISLLVRSSCFDYRCEIGESRSTCLVPHMTVLHKSASLSVLPCASSVTRKKSWQFSGNEGRGVVT